jgi:Fe2+ transport system protein B
MDIDKIVKEAVEKHEPDDVVQNITELPPQKDTDKESNLPTPIGVTGVIGNIVESYIPDQSKSINEQAKEAVDVLMVKEAISDKKTVGELAEHKKTELKSRAEANAEQEKTKSTESKIALQKAEFGIYDGIADYAGIKKSLPKQMQKILMIPLQIIVGILLFIFGSIASAINVILDCVNAIMLRFSTLTESSKKFVKNFTFFLLVCGGLAALYLGIKAILIHYGIWFK